MKVVLLELRLNHTRDIADVQDELQATVRQQKNTMGDLGTRVHELHLNHTREIAGMEGKLAAQDSSHAAVCTPP